MKDKVVVNNSTAPDTAIDRTNDEVKVVVDDPVVAESDNPKDSYEGRKHAPNIDGPEQASQETDEVYVDPRKQEDLPPGGKNVADLNAYDLTQHDNELDSKNNDI